MLSLIVMIGFLAIVGALGAVVVSSVRSGHGDSATDLDGDGVPYDSVEAVGRTKAEEERAQAGSLDSLGDAGGPGPSTAEVEAARRLDEDTRRRREG
ncbi:hypothetical protein OG984_07685 [Nocardioides sp. NBC_00368]|uniref:hypothetical protein n=1 Tax=Nocardioides sp. NBC_00368 TaxID=2976000 RepID=UPI002E23E565